MKQQTHDIAIKELDRKNYPEEYRAGVPIFEPRK